MGGVQGSVGPVSLEVYAPDTGALRSLASVVLAGRENLYVSGLAVDWAGTVVVVDDTESLWPLDSAFASSTQFLWVGGPPKGMNGAAYTVLARGGETLFAEGPPWGLATVRLDPRDGGGDALVDILASTWPDGGGLVDGDPISLVGTGDGRLFVPCTYEGPGVCQIDPTTGATIQLLATGMTWEDVNRPFAFWRGDFYAFPPANGSTVANPETLIVRFGATDGSREVVGDFSGGVSAAASSPCAPLR